MRWSACAHRVLFAVGFSLLLALPLSAQMTGTWSGTYTSVSSRCGAAGKSSGTVTLAVTQSSATFDGNIVVQQSLVNCAAVVPPISVVLPISGSVSGGSFSASMLYPFSDGVQSASVSGSFSGTSMSLTFSGGDTTAQATLTRSSSQAPAGPLSGSYSGTYSVTLSNFADPCTNMTTLTFSGPLVGSLTQSGDAISALLTAQNTKDTKHDANNACTIIDTGDEPVFLTGMLDGSTFNGMLTLTDGVAPFTATINGQTISGSATGEGPDGTRGTVSFTITRSGSSLTPVVAQFAADPTSIQAGQSATLMWTVLYASGVSIDNGIGNRNATGSLSVTPSATTTYTLTVPGSSAKATATVNVIQSSSSPSVAVSEFPSGMLQTVGGPAATDHYTLTNSGGTPTQISLAQSGTFFTFSPQSFTLAPGASQTVSITAAPQAAGIYEGLSIVNGPGLNLNVPIRLLIAAAPSGSVTAVAETARAEVSAPPSTNPAGSVSFTNRGTGVLQGIAVSDASWLFPQSGTITINPGETKAISFSTDRTRRADAGALLGAATATLSLRFLGGGSNKGVLPLGTTPSSTVSVTIVDVVKPGVASGTPPALSAGELALFVAGLSSRPGSSGDLLLSSRAPIPDLRIYCATATGGSQVSSIGQLPSNASAAFPGIVKNVFGTDAQTATVQLRSQNMASVAIAAVQTGTSAASGGLSTSLPILRSDRGAAASQSLYLVGVARDSSLRTNVYLQEMTGNAATVKLDFIDANGTILSSRNSDSLGPFGFAELTDVVPANATMVRVTNTSSGSARLGAYALVVNSSTGDARSVVDLATAGADDFIAPMPPASAQPVAREIYFTNASSAPVTVAATTYGSGSSRHRATTHSSDHASPLSSKEKDFTIPPLGSVALQVSDTGFVRASAPPNAIHASGSFTATSTTGAFGSGVPAVPVNTSLTSGQSMRFTGIDDATIRSLSRNAGAALTSNLMLVETTGQSATVRLTLQYSFAGGAYVMGNASVSKEVTVSGNNFVLLQDLVRNILGTQRDSYGDLHDAQLDVQVTGGSGRILPFLETIDNASGDVNVRAQ